MSNLGRRLIAVKDEDFKNLEKYFKSFKIKDVFFEPENMNLLKQAHNVTFALHLFISKLTNIPEMSKPYLEQLKNSSIQILSNIQLGNKTALKLQERLLIENTFRYIYYRHHEIEHILLQLKPSKYINISELFRYVKNHPFFIEITDEINNTVDTLNNKYSELSREIHTSTLQEMEIVNNVASLYDPIPNSQKEADNLKIIFQNILFVVGYFHRDKYATLSHDERPILTSFLKDEHIRILSGLR